MNSSRVLLVMNLGGIIAVGCAVSADGPSDSTFSESPGGPFHKAILEVAAEYTKWGRVDDEMRWAPAFCRPTAPGKVYVSASQNEQTHGRKLYSVYARQRDDYVTHEKSVDPVAVGQVVVKQSWVPVEIIDPDQRPDRKSDFDYGKVLRTPALQPDAKYKLTDNGIDHFYPYVWDGDKAFRASKQAELFIMMKLDPTRLDTDNGWVYATATPDGKQVTAAGRIESCMNCHRTAKLDRLFGLGK